MKSSVRLVGGTIGIHQWKTETFRYILERLLRHLKKARSRPNLFALGEGDEWVGKGWNGGEGPMRGGWEMKMSIEKAYPTLFIIACKQSLPSAVGLQGSWKTQSCRFQRWHQV